MSSGDGEQDFDDTIEENAFLANVFDSSGGARQFLERRQKIYIRGTSLDISASSVWLKYQTDIDGCVIELNDLSGVRIPVRHVNICPRGLGSLKEVKGVLKKHINLSEYSANALKNFNQSVGIQLFYEHGWECWLALLPDPSVRAHELTKSCIRGQALEAFQKLRSDLRAELTQYLSTREACRTLSKNDLTDLRQVNVLPDDCPKILEAVQRAVSKVHVRDFKPVVFCFRFGEKSSAGVSLCDFRPECIEKVTVHAAVDISCDCPGVELMWCASGIQQLVGQRGILSTCLSLFDCANYQSNVDGRPIDVKPELRSIFRVPDKLKFVQLYADLPHVKPNTRLHPVSGIIAGGLCFPTNMALAFRRDANKYIGVISNNFGQLRSSTCRLEGVCELNEWSDVVTCSDCIDVSRLFKLFEQKPLIAPIVSRSLACIRSVGLFLCQELSEMLTYNTTGNVRASWRAFQCELAVEKLLWGKPLSPGMRRYAINLGPGVLGASRSLTDELGFLALEEPSSCMTNENSIPPTTIWTASVGLGESIRRVVGLHDHIDASFPVIGRLLISALLKDLHSTGKMELLLRFEEFLAFLKSDPAANEIVGAVTLEGLTSLLCHDRRYAVFMVFGKLCGMLKKHQLPCKQIIEAGLIEVGLKKFPAVETYDLHGNAVLKWDRRMNYWKVLPSSQADATCVRLCPELYSQLAKGALETRGLIFPSRLKKLPALWPWIDPCLRKLERERLDDEALITVLAFISCLAFLMQGWFIDFERFEALHDNLPIPQFRLKTLQIQSTLVLSSMNYKNLRIFRLHETIPHQFPAVEKRHEARSVVDERPEEPPKEETGNRIGVEEDVSETPQLIQTRTATCQPVGLTKATWTSEELEILDNVQHSSKVGESLRDLYDRYVQASLLENVSFRSFPAFKRKAIRLRSYSAMSEWRT